MNRRLTKNQGELDPAESGMSADNVISWASSPGRRRIMLGNRRANTEPELAVRRRLHAMGLRFRVDQAPEPQIRCRADIVFTRAKIAVFVDGCFWHGCPLHYRPPATNVRYWIPKIEANVERDQRNSRELTEAGWLVLRYWEHEPVEEVVAEIQNHYVHRLKDIIDSSERGA